MTDSPINQGFQDFSRAASNNHSFATKGSCEIKVPSVFYAAMNLACNLPCQKMPLIQCCISKQARILIVRPSREHSTDVTEIT